MPVHASAVVEAEIAVGDIDAGSGTGVLEAEAAEDAKAMRLAGKAAVATVAEVGELKSDCGKATQSLDAMVVAEECARSSEVEYYTRAAVVATPEEEAGQATSRTLIHSARMQYVSDSGWAAMAATLAGLVHTVLVEASEVHGKATPAFAEAKAVDANRALAERDYKIVGAHYVH